MIETIFVRQRLDVDVDRAVAREREGQVRAVAGHGLEVGAHRQIVDVRDVVLRRAECDGEVFGGGEPAVTLAASLARKTLVVS